MSDNNQETKRRGRPRKAASELVNNPNSNAVRAYRERKRLENETKLLEDQRVYKNMYNKEWETIRANKPDYKSTDPTYEELVSERYNRYKAQEPDRDDDKDDDKNSDTDEAVSVKSSEQLENILNEAVDEVKQELTKQQRKNLKRRNRLKQLKKGNKITEADTLHEDVD